MTTNKFSVIWSESLGQWLGLCSMYPNLSYPHINKQDAEDGIKKLARECALNEFWELSEQIRALCEGKK